MSVNEDCSDYKLDRQDYPYFTEDEFNESSVGGKDFVESLHLIRKKCYEKRITNFSLQPDEGRMDLNIVICGEAGSGKSSTANTILGSQAFRATRSSNSVTKASLDNACTYKDRRITVVDTPGINATDSNNTDVKKEIARMAFMLKDGVHCFIICMSAGDTRFTDHVKKMLKLIKQDGRGNFFDYCMLAYTKAETELETCTLGEFLEQKKENNSNRRFLEKIHGRVVAVNNSCLVPAEALRNRDALIEMVDVVVAENIRNGNPDIFTNDLFKAAGSLQEKVTSVVQKNSFHQGMVSATIEVVINHNSSRLPSSLPSDKFLKEVILILRKRKKSEEINQIHDLFDENDKVHDKYEKQIKKIYDEIQPELSRFWEIIGFITLAAAAVTVATALGEVPIVAALVGAVGTISR